MKFFYLASISNSDGKFEIHERDCPLLPEGIHRDYLGPFNSGAQALNRALVIQDKAVCCPKCCKSISKPLIFSSDEDPTVL